MCLTLCTSVSTRVVREKTRYILLLTIDPLLYAKFHGNPSNESPDMSEKHQNHDRVNLVPVMLLRIKQVYTLCLKETSITLHLNMCQNRTDFNIF